MTLHCPTCGHAVDGFSMKMLSDLHLPYQERVLLQEMVAAFPRQTTAEHLIHCLYGSRADGGPETAGQVVKTRISHIRKAIRAYGWQVSKNGIGSSGRYRLEKIED